MPLAVPSSAFWKELLRDEGWRFGKKLVATLRREMGLRVPKRKPKRRREEEAERARMKARVDGYLQTAVRAFDNGKYSLAQDLAYEASQLPLRDSLATTAATRSAQKSLECCAYLLRVPFDRRQLPSFARLFESCMD